VLEKLNQALGNRLFDTLDDLRDAALSVLDSINPPSLFIYVLKCENPGHVVVYERGEEDNRLMVVLNFGPEPAIVVPELPIGQQDPFNETELSDSNQIRVEDVTVHHIKMIGCIMNGDKAKKHTPTGHCKCRDL